MVNDKIIGILLLIVSIIVIIIYGWLVFFPPQISIMGTTIDIFVLKLTGFIAILALFGILAWIGYTLATTPPPKPIEEIEKEIEQELKKLEAELKEQQKEGVKDQKKEQQSQS
ncbi:MAG TPA: transcriptional regulator [Pyrodictium sp.]|nr:transcriptional regulator [Pyrodictium sp.]